jgi:hypothetical protein
MNETEIEKWAGKDEMAALILRILIGLLGLIGMFGFISYAVWAAWPISAYNIKKDFGI